MFVNLNRVWSYQLLIAHYSLFIEKGRIQECVAFFRNNQKRYYY